MKNWIYLLVIGILVFMSPYSSSIAGEDDHLKFGSIPFGKTVEDCSKIFGEGMTKSELFNNFLSYSFSGGYKVLEEVYFNGQGLSTQWINQYTIMSGPSKGADLYFVKELQKDEYTLFMVCKTFEIDYGAFEPYFKGLKDSITKRVGIIPKIHRTVYRRGSYRSPDVEGLVGVWTLKDQRVFLLARNDLGVYSGIIYLSLTGWNKYLDHIRSDKLKQENKGRKAGEKF
jgi:hypothetical protein